MRGGKTQYVILGLLAEGPMSGYDIKKVIDFRFSFFWNESYGQLYPMLKALAGKKLITAEKSRGGRAKVTYAITPQGRAALKDWLARPVEKETVRFELLLKMYFAGETETDVMKRHVRAFMEMHAQGLALLDIFERELKSIVQEHGNHADVLRVIAFGQKVYGAYIDWCEETLNYLEEKKFEA